MKLFGYIAVESPSLIHVFFSFLENLISVTSASLPSGLGFVPVPLIPLSRLFFFAPYGADLRITWSISLFLYFVAAHLPHSSSVLRPQATAWVDC